MTVAKLIPTFDTTGTAPVAAASEAQSAAGSERTDPERSFEEGYSSGWDDAVRAAEERGERISAEFERMVQDLGFSYHEALDQLRGQFLDALAGFLDALLPAALPDLVRAHLEAALSEHEPNELPIVLVVSHEQVSLFQSLIDDENRISIELQGEDSLSRDQAFFKISGQQTLMDFGSIVQSFREQIGALAQKTEEDTRHVG